MSDLRESIQSALASCAKGSLANSAKALFNTLGYESDRTASWTLESFLELGATSGKPLTAKEQAELRRLKSLELIFQVGDQELSKHVDLFDSSHTVDAQRIQSYIFFAVDLPHGAYTRGELTTIARLINKPLPMPAIVLFRHGGKDEPLISIAIIRRRLNKRDAAKDVLDKATLIKDIRCADPIRAHIEILHDFSLPCLREFDEIPNFVKLHAAWEKKLDSYALSNAFYREIADWYFWAHHQVEDGVIRLPEHCDTPEEKSLFLIRLLTRMIFCWFLVEKRLIPVSLFRPHALEKLIKDFHPSTNPEKPDSSSSYYHTVLQNLFFGTLNMPREQRGFREKKKAGERYDKNFGITTLWRHETTFHEASEWEAIANRVPFLNGGLFDCLDDKSGKKTDNFILDGFSDNPKLSCHLPNDLFFGPERPVNLSKDYGEEKKKTARSKKAKVRGLIEILSRYKFTIEENTPLEEEIALDPELLGKVFENLLASYNDDTKTTARKALGAFYTPREIVGYMVDESLKSYLTSQVPKCKGALEDLFSNKATLKEIQPVTRAALIDAIGRVKILDPACGSGAFPMGALHRLVDLLQKLDPNNERWREVQRKRAIAETEAAFDSGDKESREHRLKEINNTFEFNSSDYGRKLYLIENAIYGVDIQPVAVQIAKLRFFISLVVDQRVCPEKDDLGVRPLPNLETRLVAADTLIPIPRPKLKQASLFGDDAATHKQVDALKKRLVAVRHKHFNARDPRKKRDCKDEDETIRAELGEVLKKTGMDSPAAAKLAQWDPYDQNTFAPFFDSEWMFGLPVGMINIDSPSTPATLRGNLGLINETDGQTELSDTGVKVVESGFDIVIGNPPYGAVFSTEEKANFNKIYSYQDYQIDSYLLFIERGMELLRKDGIQALITSNSWLPSLMFKKIRAFIFGATQVVSVLDVATKVFAAVVDTTVLIHRKRQMNQTDDLEVLSFGEHGISSQYRAKQANWFSVEGKPVSIRATPKLQGVIAIMECHEVVGNFFKVTPGCKAFQVGKGRPKQTREIVNEKPFIAAIKKDKTFRPLLRGRLIGRFMNHWNEDYWISFGDWLAEPRHTANYDAPVKIVVRQTGDSLIATLDRRQFIVMNNMFTIIPISSHFTAEFALGVINSIAANWYYQTVVNPEKGEALAEVKRGHLVRIPVPKAEVVQQCAVRSIVETLLGAKQIQSVQSGNQNNRDPLMLSYWERVLNGLVYELYFAEEVHDAGVYLFDLVEKANLPDVNAVSEKDRLPTLRQKFEELYDGAHPLRIALDKLQTLDTVRIIEGKA